MNDREMLEFAAKAAGYEFDEHVKKGGCWIYETTSPLNSDGEHPIYFFNPLDDDGDCARLEAAIGIDVAWRGLFVVAEMKNRIFHSYEFFKDYNGDKNRARRYASTKCAAEIGRNMEQTRSEVRDGENT